jgi:formate hydrogenlyase subunit 6/NADH:ubiquinone oxidoreductase subunit I
MLVKSIKKADLKRWLSRISERVQLYVPQRRHGGDVVLGPWGAGELELRYGRLLESPKRLLLPQADPLFRFEGYRVEGLFDERERVLFGVRPCDAAAMAILDQFFEEHFPDPHYLARREHLALIVLACNEPEATCFCPSTGTGPFARSGFDVQLIDLGDTFLVQVATEKGEALVEMGRELFQEAPAGWQELLERWQEQASVKFQVSLDLQRAAELVRTGTEPEGFWESVAKRCLMCGGCAFICPTCSCFEMADIVAREAPARSGESEGPKAPERSETSSQAPQAVRRGESETPPDQGEGRKQPRGARVRLWDSCVLAGFTREASGHNPRQEQERRCARRYQHKLSRPVGGSGGGGGVAEPAEADGDRSLDLSARPPKRPESAEGALQLRFRCVGCGRCVEACLSSLGMIQVVRELTARPSPEIDGATGPGEVVDRTVLRRGVEP